MTLMTSSRNILPVAILCLTLGACATIPPSGPHLSALPGKGKSEQVFDKDDIFCRNAAQNAVTPAAAEGQGGLQQHYDRVYAQCMSGKGHDIERPERVDEYGPGYGLYYGPYPYFYGGFWSRRW